MKDTMKYFLLIMLFILSGFHSASAQTVANDIQKAEDYLRNLSTVKANFIQTAYNGARLSGTFYLNRPGKLRFDYNEIDDFIVADGLFIYFYDSELGEQSNAPIGQTLADFLLRDNISLTGDIKVQDIAQEEGLKMISLVQTDDLNAGLIKLFFQEDPYLLRKWQVIDAAGLTTEIELSHLEKDVEFPRRLFAYIAPKKDTPNYNE